MSIFHGSDVIDFINKHGLETLTHSQQRDFKVLVGGAETFHDEEINGFYTYQSVKITPLMLAAYYVNPEMVTILLEHGADASLTAKGNIGLLVEELLPHEVSAYLTAKGHVASKDRAINFASFVLETEENIVKKEMLYTLKDHTSPGTRYARTVQLLQDAESK